MNFSSAVGVLKSLDPGTQSLNRSRDTCTNRYSESSPFDGSQS